MSEVRVQIRSRINPGIYQDCQDAEWSPEFDAPYTEKNVSIAETKIDAINSRLVGSYGNRGCGEGANIYIVSTDDDGEALMWSAEWAESDYDNAMSISGWSPIGHDEKLPEYEDEGDLEITFDDVVNAAAPEWNGNNWVGGNPGALMEATGVSTVNNGVFQLDANDGGVLISVVPGYTEVACEWDGGHEFHADIEPDIDTHDLKKAAESAGVVLEICDLTTNDEYGQSCLNICYAVADENLQDLLDTINNNEDE